MYYIPVKPPPIVHVIPQKKTHVGDKKFCSCSKNAPPVLDVHLINSNLVDIIFE